MSNSVILLKRNKLKELVERDSNDNSGAMKVVYGTVGTKFVTSHEKLFKEVDKTKLKSLKNELFKFIHEGHTVFSNSFRSILYGDKKGYTFNGLEMLRHLTFKNDGNTEFLFQMICGYYLEHQPLIRYEKPNVKVSLQQLSVNNLEEVKIEKIPDDIQEILRTHNIEQMEKVLKLNPRTGYYEYTSENGTAHPIMCKHMFMYLKHVSMIEISIECVKNGKCVYCGQEMSNYSEHLVVDISSAVVSIIYQFFELIPLNFNMTHLYYATVEYLTKLLERNNIITDQKQQLFTYLFFYSYLHNTSLTIKTVSKQYKQFELNCSKIANANGFTMNDLKTFKMVDDYQAYENIVYSHIYSTKITYFSFIPISVLFKVDSFDDFSKLNAETSEQKMFKEGKTKAFNDQIDNLLKSLFKMELIQRPIEYEFKESKMKKFHEEGVLFVFLQIIDQFCPIETIHKFEKGKCVHCGFNGKNGVEIFEKLKLKQGTLLRQFLESFQKITKEIAVSEIKENEIITIAEKFKYYKQIIETIGKDSERDKRILEDIFKIKLKDLSSSNLIKHFIKFAKETSNENLEWLLLYYYGIGIAESSYSLIYINFIEDDEDE